MLRLLLAVVFVLFSSSRAPDRSRCLAAEPVFNSLHVSVFQSDATPPLGTPVAYALARKIEDPLSARGIVLLGVGKPIVLCAVDWISIPMAATTSGAKALLKLSALRSIA